MLKINQQNTPSENEHTQRREASWFLDGCCSLESNATRTILRSEPFKLGRSPEADLILNANDISKFHAEIITVGEVVILKDLGSTNGTYVNGCRITEPTPVGEGDLLQFASLEFQLGRMEEQQQPDYHTCEVDGMESRWMITQMHQVLYQKQFWMAYQPIVSAKDLSRHGVEALIRCDIPGLQSPFQLFQTATQLGLETSLSEASRVKTAEELSQFPAQSCIFVNTHPHELLDTRLIDALNEINQILGPWKLVVEIHEAAVPDLQTIREFKQSLHDLEIQLAYDDFGAGQSRLLELIEVPPDYVKFDRAMVDGLATGSSRQVSIVESLVQFCRDNQIQTIAEGIDNEQDGNLCREIGFDLLQGFFYGRPEKRETTLPLK
jgi:EAL domain-containing protein (putative c-di-GMP-specific phosphodiesterase class I)|tara:strand:+ start:81552 stop:82688 length:1137 start_codon:yes stop_codon:yes gene_type:complete